MRGAVRQFACCALLAAYALLWTGGAAWHAVACCGHHHGRPGAGRAASATACRHAQCCTHQHHHSSDHDSSPDAGDEPQHDPDDCQVCRWFAQGQRPVEVVVLVRVQPHGFTSGPPLVCLRTAEPLRSYDARGPPV